jgi:hypothetical protein
MKIIELDQNSEEWLEYRKGKSGGSAFGKLYKVNGRTNETLKDQFFVMLAERVARPMTPNDYLDRIPEGLTFSWAVRGHILEPEAAKAFELETGKILDDGKVWASDYDPSSYVSPDRVIKSSDGKIREAVEIKCLSSEKVLKIWWERRQMKEGQSDFIALPSNEYQAQVIKYFMVNDDLETLYWVVYTDLIPKLELQILKIRRTDISALIEDAKGVEMMYLATLDRAEKILEEL